MVLLIYAFQFHTPRKDQVIGKQGSSITCQHHNSINN